MARTARLGPLSLVLALLCAPVAAAERVLVGASLPLSGPLAGHGQAWLRGLQLGLGLGPGSEGTERTLTLQALDDRADPAQMARNAQSLAEAGAVALTGFGTGAETVLPVLTAQGLPLVGVASGSEALREPVHPWVFHLRAGVQDEAGAMVIHLDLVGLTDVATVSQADVLGQAGRHGMRSELARYAIRPVAQVELPVQADAAAVQAAVAQACTPQPQALVLMLEPVRALAALQQARQLGCGRLRYVFNEVGMRLLAQPEGAQALKGVVVPQLLPHPSQLGSPLVAAFQRAAGPAGVAPSYAALEGYLHGRVLVEALARCGREVSRRCVAHTLESRPLEVGGYRLSFSPHDHRGSHWVDMTIVTADGRLRR
ncbi:ABC transporter substrate-binding protein [Ideonella livida]|uniref:ABC transporter substrate-binding protein n=1 Tax=Ideonella livida TaxID=2707176 RepID=A0A7C9TN56_9BURK|nr:ABC transporter substrate-binding protein [Ideonella livida]NDY93523.1 ABC transporter substrate-binding protein [Ideonella livida]